MAQYIGIATGHWVSRKLEGGKIIVLNDNSTWEIASLDRIKTTLWLTTQRVDIDTRVGGYILINRDTGEQVAAKYLGKK